MSPAWIFLINMTVAGFVGGITNHFAIKMLFHPREEKRIGRFRVPFTPGLIPKRKDEIGRTLGKVVADHLVTAEGLQNMLAKPEFQGRMEQRLMAWVDDWAAREDTVEELLLRVWPKEALDDGRNRSMEWLKDRVAEGVNHLWKDGGWSQRRLGELIPSWTPERREELTVTAVRKLVEEIRRELDTLQGERMLRTITAQFMEQAGGFLGALAGIFMDGDKVAVKVKWALVQQLESPALQGFAASFIRDRLTKLENMTLEEALRMVSSMEPEEWLKEQSGRLLDEVQAPLWDKLAGMRLSELIGSRREWLHERIPGLVDRMLKTLTQQMPRVIEVIQLPKLVEEEVRRFPIEQLEDIILSVSGKEFRAITWLGVMLGAMIGLFQSFMLLWQR